MNIFVLAIIGISVMTAIVFGIFMIGINSQEPVPKPVPDLIPYPIPESNTLSNQDCAKLFDKIFDTWEEYVKENYGGPGQPTLEPPTVAGIVSDWQGGEEFRNTDCRYRVNDWAYLVKHKEQVWGYVDWPKLEPFKYEPKPEEPIP